MITGLTFSTTKPNLAGSPTSGSSLNNGTATLTNPTAPGSSNDTAATPTAVCGGHASAPSLFSTVKNCASVHDGVAVGFPIKPAGHLKWRSFASATGSTAGTGSEEGTVCPGGTLSAVWFNVSVVVCSNGWEPACVSGLPPASSFVSS